MKRMFLALSALGTSVYFSLAADQTPPAAPQAQTQQPCCCARMSGGRMHMGQMQMGGRGVRMGMGMAAFAPLPADFATDANPMTPAKIELGRMLFFEKRLSANGRLSCNSCHDLASYGVDHQPTSSGFWNQKGTRNSPTVYNAAGYFAQFWDGRAATVEEQAKGPILNPVEMGLPSGSAAVGALKSIPEYVALFSAAFPGSTDPVTFDNVAAAIGAFERTLVTPSRWDRFLAGDQSALSAEERAGFHRFMHTGCATCHNGALVGGGAYEKLGEAQPFPDTTDLGRFQVTKNFSDRMFFKVPSLRNVEQTAPYFHNGKIATLDEAVAQMGKYQLGVNLSAAEREQIIAWLKTLTGALPAQYIAEPRLPDGAGRH